MVVALIGPVYRGGFGDTFFDLVEELSTAIALRVTEDKGGGRIGSQFGYLHITSASKRCGKSLLLELFSYLCFNVFMPTVSLPQPDTLFRNGVAPSPYTQKYIRRVADPGKDRQLSSVIVSSRRKGD